MKWNFQFEIGQMDFLAKNVYSEKLRPCFAKHINQNNNKIINMNVAQSIENRILPFYIATISTRRMPFFFERNMRNILNYFSAASTQNHSLRRKRKNKMYGRKKNSSNCCCHHKNVTHLPNGHK